MHPSWAISINQSTGAVKASAALDSFANITFGFAELLIGDCFEDVTITMVSVSQSSTPLSRRVPNDDTSSASYSDHIVPLTETVPSAVGLSTSETEQSMWIVTFIMCLLLSTCICTSVGVKCIRARGAKLGEPVRAVANGAESKGAYGASSAVPSDYSNRNRLYYPGVRAVDGRSRSVAQRQAERRAAQNINPIGQQLNFETSDAASTEDCEVCSVFVSSPFDQELRVPRLDFDS